MIRASIAVAAAVLLLTTVAAQPKVDFSAAAAEADREMPAPGRGAGPGAAAVNADVTRARAEYDAFTLMHAQRTFTWQYWSGVVVFVVVMTTVIVGLWLSYLHFRDGRRGGSEVNQFKMSATGVEISSPVIGLLILTVSLGFFYLYLTQVYPITAVAP